MDVGAVYGGMTSGGPTAAGLQFRSVRNFADVNFTRGHRAGSLDLRMAAQAKIRIGLQKHLSIH